MTRARARFFYGREIQPHRRKEPGRLARAADHNAGHDPLEQRATLDVMVPVSPAAIHAALAASATIPIFALDFESDPIARGWIKSLSRPGGQVTVHASGIVDELEVDPGVNFRGGVFLARVSLPDKVILQVR